MSRSRARDPAWVNNERNRVRILVDDYTIRIRDLNTYYNTLSPISSLPFEILAKIFEHRASSEGYWGSKCTFFSWLDVATVCREWREVALNSPPLWCNIHLVDDVRAGFTQQFLDRSQGLPLTLTLIVRRSVPTQALWEVHRQSHRIKAMDVSLKKVDYDALWDGPLFRPLPSLKHLTLTKPGMFGWAPGDGSDDSPSVIPVTREGFDISAVRELVVAGYQLGEHSSIWTQHLTSLQLSYNDTQPRDILKVLSLLPNLQDLSSDQAPGIGGDNYTPTSPDTPVQLRRLQQLHLGGSIPMCVSILSNIVFPASATLSINVHQYQQESQLPWLVQCLVSHLSGTRRIGKAEPVRSCAFSKEVGIDNQPFQAILHLRKHDVSYGRYHYDVSDDPPPAFKLTFGLFSVSTNVFVEKVFLLLPLRSVTSLSLAGTSHHIFKHNLVIFSKLCEAMPNITSLNSRDRGELFSSDFGPCFIPIEPLCILLGQLPPQDDAPTSPTSRGISRGQHAGRAQLVHVPRYGFSQLKMLRLEGIAFQPASTTPWRYKSYVSPDEYAETMDAWMKVLQDRRRNGFPITTLVLRNCYRVGVEDVQRFRTAVRDVRWDGNVLVKIECESDDRPWLPPPEPEDEYEDEYEDGYEDEYESGSDRPCGCARDERCQG